MLKMLIAVDGSEHSLHAIDAVAALARASLEVEAVLVNVRSFEPLFGDLPPLDFEQVAQFQRKEQDRILDAAQEHARACGLRVASVHRADGPPASEIVRVAAECGASQIVLGTRGLGALGSLFMGSVAQRVVHLSELPVMLVK